MPKTIFAVIAVDNPAAIQQAMARAYALDSLLVGQGQWLVADEGTAQTVTVKLGVATPEGQGTAIGGALVLAVSGYFGRKQPQVWEWLKAKWGSV